MLLVDAWHPSLSAGERGALRRFFELDEQFVLRRSPTAEVVAALMTDARAHAYFAQSDADAAAAAADAAAAETDARGYVDDERAGAMMGLDGGGDPAGLVGGGDADGGAGAFRLDDFVADDGYFLMVERPNPHAPRHL